MPMLHVGYKLSSEEFDPADLIRQAVRAETAGFDFALISDHFHPWADRQGQSPFVWSVLGGIAGATERFVVGTGITCPIIRTHPAIVAHAAATVATMMPGRFFLGSGRVRTSTSTSRGLSGLRSTCAARCWRRR